MVRILYFTLIFILVILLANCNSKKDLLFTQLSESTTGIKFKNTLFKDGPMNVANYIYFYNGGGVAIGDINNDGLPDIFFTANIGSCKLYLNKGGFHFDDITKTA